MNIHIMHRPPGGNENLCRADLPPFDWRRTGPLPASRLAAAHRIATRTGIPVGVVLVHYERAGLGMES